METMRPVPSSLLSVSVCNPMVQGVVFEHVTLMVLDPFCSVAVGSTAVPRLMSELEPAVTEQLLTMVSMTLITEWAHPSSAEWSPARR